jgi:hypothetical protein
MALISKVVSDFVNSKLVPAIVAETLSLNENGKTQAEIVEAICGKAIVVEALITGTDVKTPVPKKSVAKPPNNNAVDLDVYIKDFHGKQVVCVQEIARGDQKGKICCAPLKEGTYVDGDFKTQRCTKHKNAEYKDIEAMIRSKTNMSDTAERVEKVKVGLPKGAPKAFSDEPQAAKPAKIADGLTSSKDSSVSGSHGSAGSVGSLKARLSRFKKEEPKETTPEKEKTPAKETTPETPAKETTPEAPKESTPEKEKTPAKETTPEKEFPPTRESSPVAEDPKDSPVDSPSSSNTSKSVTETPKSHREMTLDEFENSLPNETDSDGEEQCNIYLTPDLPEATKFTWLLVSEKEILVFSRSTRGNLKSCYGRYKTASVIDPKAELSLSDGWKKLLEPLTKVQLEYIDKLGAPYKTFDE